MASMCPKCGGSGINMQDEFCTRCPDGRLLKAQADAKKKAAEAKKKEGPPKPEPKKSPVLEVQEGDWVLYNGYVGWVTDVDGYKMHVIAIRRKDSEVIIKDNRVKGWVDGIGVKPMPPMEKDIVAARVFIRALERQANGMKRRAAIDAALDARDKERFLELAKEEYEEGQD